MEWPDNLEDYAIHRKPIRGKCPSSPFAIGWHRVGTIPTLSLLDGGAPGDTATDICLHCGRMFGRRFIIRKQPRMIGESWQT